jgi:hypothetical protein
MSKNLYIFIHIGKTGGTTFNAHLYQQKGWDSKYVHLGPFGDEWREKKGLTPWMMRSQAERNKAKVLAGHGTFWGIHNLVLKEGLVPKYFTFFRDPITRVESHYSFDCNITGYREFEDWYEEVGHNYVYRHLSRQFRTGDIDAICNILDRFWMIGFQETLDPNLEYIFDQIGIKSDYNNYRVRGKSLARPVVDKKQKSSEIYELTEDQKKLVLHTNTKDYLIYHYVRNHYV